VTEHDDPTTTPESSHDGAAAADRQHPSVLGLVVLHGVGDRQHVGSFVPVTSREAVVLGRGGDDVVPSRRAIFLQQRPSQSKPLPPLRNQALSRNQLELRSVDGRVAVRNVGRLSLSVNGELVDDATLSPGDVLEIGRQLVLLATARPARFHGGTPEPNHAFGAADAFGFVGESPAAWELRRELAFVAERPGHVVVLGPSGTGKDLVAAAIHALSMRKGPLVARNAATLPESLIDAELFGNPKGYPNPGTPERKGLVGAAHTGTLFLDEIGDLAPSAQPHLLRVLDRGEYQRLGESERRVSDIRLIAATNLPESSLRSDLFARFDFRVRMPPLSERREDVALLVPHLLESLLSSGTDTARFRAHNGEFRLGTTLVRRLVQHAYTLHVRELRRLLVESIWRSPGDTLEWPEAGSPAAASEERAGDGAPAAALDPEAIQTAIDDCNGSLEKAWRKLGLSSRHALSRLVQRHRLVVTRRR
jgi:two-component system response regulator HydG